MNAFLRGLLPLLLLTSYIWTREAKTYGSFTVANVVRVIDGDTFRVNISGVPPLIGESIPVRLARIDTPELSSENPEVKALALRAKAFTEAALRGAREIRLENTRRDKYFRILADVLIDGEDLSDKLIEAKLAVPYSGGKKATWPLCIAF